MSQTSFHIFIFCMISMKNPSPRYGKAKKMASISHLAPLQAPCFDQDLLNKLPAL